MPHLVLSEEQVQVLREASDLVEVRDGQGQVLARLVPPAEAALVAEAKRRLAAGGPRYSSAEVRARLQRLEELSAEQELDAAQARELLRRMRAGEQV